MYYSNKGKYIRSNDDALTWWHHHVCTTSLPLYSVPLYSSYENEYKDNVRS